MQEPVLQPRTTFSLCTERLLLPGPWRRRLLPSPGAWGDINEAGLIYAR